MPSLIQPRLLFELANANTIGDVLLHILADDAPAAKYAHSEHAELSTAGPLH